MKNTDNLTTSGLSLSKYATLVKQSSAKGGNTIVLENMIDKIIGMSSSLSSKNDYND